MNTKLHRNLWGSVGVVAFIAIAGCWLCGCGTMGYNRGYKDAKRFYGEGKDVYTWAYPYKYHKGWEAYILERGRKIRHVK